ncbi:hypothetical protein A4A49_59458, partial [Nicotiana attenuata]
QRCKRQRANFAEGRARHFLAIALLVNTATKNAKRKRGQRGVCALRRASLDVIATATTSANKLQMLSKFSFFMYNK